MDLQDFIDPRRDILFCKDILDREHRHAVRDLHARLPLSCAAYLLGRGIRRDPFRILFFRVLKLLHQAVILEIADRRRILIVITIHMLIDRCFQLLVLFSCHVVYPFSQASRSFSNSCISSSVTWRQAPDFKSPSLIFMMRTLVRLTTL